MAEHVFLTFIEYWMKKWHFLYILSHICSRFSYGFQFPKFVEYSQKKVQLVTQWI